MRIMTEERMKSWQNICFSVSGISFLMCFVSFIFQFNIIFSQNKYKDIEINQAKILAAKSPKSAETRLLIKDGSNKLFNAPCLRNMDLCGKDNFLYEVNVDKVKALKETDSGVLIKELHFPDGKIYKDLNNQEALYAIDSHARQAAKSVLILLFSAILFFVSGYFLYKIRKKIER